jgi:hypothetical protein
MVKRLLIFYFLFPLALLASPKDELLTQISQYFDQENFEDCAQYAKT